MINGFNGAIVYLFPREKYLDAFQAVLILCGWGFLNKA